MAILKKNSGQWDVVIKDYDHDLLRNEFYGGLLPFISATADSSVCLIELKTKISTDGGTTWSSPWATTSNALTIGNRIRFQLHYKNLQSTTSQNIKAVFMLPSCVAIDYSAITLINTAHPSGATISSGAKLLTHDGVSIGTYSANGDAYVRVDGTIIDRGLVMPSGSGFYDVLCARAGIYEAENPLGLSNNAIIRIER